MPDGKVLIAGGLLAGQSAELYDPATGQFTVTGSMNGTHDNGATAVLLPNGKVLLAWGNVGTGYSTGSPAPAGYTFVGGFELDPQRGGGRSGKSSAKSTKGGGNGRLAVDVYIRN